MQRIPRDLLLLAVALFTWGVGEGMFTIFQPLYLQQWGADPLQIGAILGLVGIAMTVVQAPSGYLSDRVGARPVLWAAWILGTLAALLMALAGSLAVFVVGLVVYGLTSFVVAPMDSYITSARGSWGVERALTLVSAMFHLGAVAGPVIGGIVGERYGLQWVYRIAALIFLLSTVVVLQLRHAAQNEEIHLAQSTPAILRNPRFLGLLVMILLTMFALNLPQPLSANYLQNQQGFSLETIGWLGALGSLGNAFWLLVLGHLPAARGLIAGQALVGIFALLLWQGQQRWLFFVGYFFLGGYRLARSMVVAYARRFVRAREQGLAFGLVATGSAVSSILAPLVAGWLYSRSPTWMYSVALSLIVATALLNLIVLSRMRRDSLAAQDPIPVMQQERPE